MPVPQEIFCDCGTTGKMPVPQEIFCNCGRTGKMPVPQEIFCDCGTTGKMPVPQEIFCDCGTTGKMPVPQEIFCDCGTGKMPVQYFLENSKLKNYKFMKKCIKIRKRIYNSTINYTCLKKPIANG
ncbi:hypothetical protein, partial [Microcoleus sp. M2_C6]|uniref:hypothetical protein n=1 Tax=unclassified Microcoleus TaxID=2642155 RepID=UPI002FD23121